MRYFGFPAPDPSRNFQSRKDFHHGHPPAAQRLQGNRSHRPSRRTDGRAPARRLGRRRDQDRAARRRCHRRHRQPAQRPGFPEPAPQQAEPHAQPEDAGRPQDLLRAGEERRRRGGELQIHRQAPARRRLRGGEEGQPAHRLRQHLRLRAGRPVRGPARRRPDRPGHGRAHVDYRASRRRARCASASRSTIPRPACCSPTGSSSRCSSASAPAKASGCTPRSSKRRSSCSTSRRRAT